MDLATATELLIGDNMGTRLTGRTKLSKERRKKEVGWKEGDTFKYWNAGAGRVILLRKYTVIRLT